MLKKRLLESKRKYRKLYSEYSKLFEENLADVDTELSNEVKALEDRLELFNINKVKKDYKDTMKKIQYMEKEFYDGSMINSFTR